MNKAQNKFFFKPVILLGGLLEYQPVSMSGLFRIVNQKNTSITYSYIQEMIHSLSDMGIAKLENHSKREYKVTLTDYGMEIAKGMVGVYNKLSRIKSKV